MQALLSRSSQCRGIDKSKMFQNTQQTPCWRCKEVLWGPGGRQLSECFGEGTLAHQPPACGISWAGGPEQGAPRLCLPRWGTAGGALSALLGRFHLFSFDPHSNAVGETQHARSRERNSTREMYLCKVTWLLGRGAGLGTRFLGLRCPRSNHCGSFLAHCSPTPCPVLFCTFYTFCNFVVLLNWGTESW